MAKLKENQVTRSTSQALYKYVPNRWIDFYFSSNRRGYTAFVKGWSSIPLEDINKKRLLRKVSNAVHSYQHDKRMNDCLPPILFSAIFKLLKVLPDTELDAC